MFDERSNETLVLLTLAGDSGAYETLVKKYEKAVYASAFAVTRSHHMAEDVSQDAFVSAWVKLNTLSEPSKFGSWVCRIAENCAKNTLARFHAFLPLEDVEWSASSDVSAPEEDLIASEQQKEIRETVAKLPERVRKVIELHYFSDLPIDRIAEKMGITVGTVKSQLFEGRRRLRKELSAMNEQIDDTLTEKVMKKVEELKLWALKNDKTGFEKVYDEVLSEVETLPESEKKHHAMADVLLRGYWWLPGKANDELLARLKDSALRGGNDEAMIFILQKEDYKFWGKQRIEFMRDVQIPMLEKAGMSGALAREWHWLGYEYFEENEYKKAKEAFLAAEKAAKEGDPYRYLAPAGLRLREKKKEKYKDEPTTRFRVNAELCELRVIDGQARRYGPTLEDGEGEYNDFFRYGGLWHYTSYSDGRFYDEKLAVGETSCGSDGSQLTRLPDETVITPAGTFENCRLFEMRSDDMPEVIDTWYKDGVGLVKASLRVLQMTEEICLAEYSIVGGKGLLPIAVGNEWIHVGTGDPEYKESRCVCRVVYDDRKKAYILSEAETHRKKYDERSFRDMILQISQDYAVRKNRYESKIIDVSHPIKRAEALAADPLQKAYIKAAASAMRRIMETDGEFNPKRSASGHWNFFQYSILYRKGQKIKSTNYDGRYCFEWKNDTSKGAEVLLYNDLYGILEDCAGCLWNDDWKEGYSAKKALPFAGDAVNTSLSVENGGKIETEAGVFENTLKLTLETLGFDDGWGYRGGKKEYWFADGIGIVRAAFLTQGHRKATYELSEYEGVGEGFFPCEAGMRRFYRAVDLTDGYVGSADYTYAEADGRIVVFSDRCGIRQFGPKITQYAYVDGELEVDRLEDQKKWDESRRQGQINAFYLFTHLICRNVGQLYGHEEVASAWRKERLKIIESFTYEGKIPTAWLGMYASATFGASCPTLGMTKLDGRSMDEGFDLLLRSFDLMEEWLNIPDGTELDTGNPLIFGGIKLYKDGTYVKEYIKLPDGQTAPLDEPYYFGFDPSTPYRGLTAEHGWEWFNPARSDPRYQIAIARAKAIKDKYGK